MTDHDSNKELDRLTDIMFFSASAGICFALALFCVMTPFFLSSDVLSALLLLGFFAATGGTVFFGWKSWEAEQYVQKRRADVLEELAVLKGAHQGASPS